MKCIKKKTIILEISLELEKSKLRIVLVKFQHRQQLYQIILTKAHNKSSYINILAKACNYFASISSQKLIMFKIIIYLSSLS